MKKTLFAVFALIAATGVVFAQSSATTSEVKVEEVVGVVKSPLPTFKTFYVITSDNAKHDISFTADKGGDLKGHLIIGGRRCLTDAEVQVKDEGEYFVIFVPSSLKKPVASSDVTFCARLENTVKLPKQKSFFGYAGVMELRMKGESQVYGAWFKY